MTEPRDVDALDSEKVRVALREAQAAVGAAKSVLIVGGGAVGVELAGEIKAHLPDKTVTIVQGAATLVNNSNPPLNPAALERLMAGLKDLGVEVKLGVKIEGLAAIENNNGMIVGEREYTLSDGSKLSADLTFVTTGLRRESKGHNLVAAVDDRNAVCVDEYLQVQGMPNVFCLGDANDHAETKAAFTGFNQAKHTVQNLIAAASGKAMKAYSGIDKAGSAYGTMVIPLGPRKGVGAVDTIVLGDSAVRWIKSKGLFSAAQFKEKGATLPPAPDV
jgi:NADH dehydrogenase FAD-containing subunit